MNVDHPFTILSLCSGGGGLDLGVELAIPTARVVCFVEWEGFAAEYLASCMEAGRMAPAPLWSNLRTFDGRAWRGVVDCITAGFPCQPHSLAGKRGGASDPRDLWPDVARVIGEAEPAIVFLENVPGLLSTCGLRVFQDLHAMGYRIAAGLFTASEVGATHKRERLFILAVAEGARSGRLSESNGWHADDHIDGRGEVVDDSASARHAARSRERELQQRELGQGCEVVADAEISRCEGAVAARRARADGCIAEHGGELPLFPPGPLDIDGWRRVLGIDPTIEPSLREFPDGLAADRRHWLRLLGNGVVPLVAAYALVTLWADLVPD